jgi:hypothetical protein
MRQSRSSGSVEGVMGNHDSYSDFGLSNLNGWCSHKTLVIVGSRRKSTMRSVIERSSVKLSK